MKDTNGHSDLFALLSQARVAKAKQRTKGEHLAWLRKQYIDNIFTPVAIRIPEALVGTRDKNALTGSFNRAWDKLEQPRLSVLEIAEGEFVIVDWDAPEVEEMFAEEVLG